MITRTIKGDKAGVIAHLAEKRDELRGLADRATKKADAIAYRREAAGVDWAINVLEDWEQ